jgi:periplasmic protein CpxP/Spy
MSARKNILIAALFCLASSGLAAAQSAPGQDTGGRPPMERTFHDGHFGRWWNNPHVSQALDLTDDQKQKMDDIFQQNRPALNDLMGNLKRQETLLGPMIGADQPNEDQVLAQIDKVAQARADLEKANARMLFDLRKTLTPDQWQKLKALHAQHRAEMMQRGGAGEWRHHGQPGQVPPGPPPGPGSTPPQGSGPDGPAPGDGAAAAQAPQV